MEWGEEEAGRNLPFTGADRIMLHPKVSWLVFPNAFNRGVWMMNKRIY